MRLFKKLKEMSNFSFINDGIDINDKIEEIKKDIKENEPQILNWLKDNWYKLIDVDDRIVFRSYTVILWDRLETKQKFAFHLMKEVVWI